MKGLVVAGAATLVGVAGVVGLSAATDGEPATTAAREPALATTTVSNPLEARIARLARAERAADAALARTAPAVPVAPLERRGDGSIDDTQAGRHVDRFDDDRSDDRGGDRWDDDSGRHDGDDRGRGRGRGDDDHGDDD